MQYPSIPSVSKVPDPSNLSDMLARMPDQSLKQYAMLHKDDPYTVSLAFAESNRRKQMRAASTEQPGEQPSVADQAIESMDLPENVGIGALPAQNLQNMAAGGITGYADGGGMFDYAAGSPLTNEPQKPYNMANGGIVAFARGGDAGDNKSDPVEVAIRAEGITDPRQIAFIKSIYSQETGSGKDTRTSTAGARGPMQVMPDTFKGLNKDGKLDPNNKFDQARAGVRYAVEGLRKANGDPRLGAIYYYGGQKGMKAALKGEARYDKDFPNKYPSTFKYGDKVAGNFDKILATLVPAGPAQAAQSSYSPQKQQDGSSAFVTDIKNLLGLTPEDQARKQEQLQRNRAAQSNDMERLKQYFLGSKSDYDLATGRAAQAQYPGQGRQDRVQAEPKVEQGIEPNITEGANTFTPGYVPQGVNGYGISALQQQAQQQAAPAKEEASGLAGLSKNDWLRLGFGLLGSKSPHWQTALGEAGEGLLAGRDKDAARALADKKQKMEEAYYKSHGRYYDANAAELMSGQKDFTRLQAQAMKNIAPQFKAIDEGMQGLNKTEEEKTLMKNRLYEAEMSRLKRSVYQDTIANPPDELAKYGQ